MFVALFANTVEFLIKFDFLATFTKIIAVSFFIAIVVFELFEKDIRTDIAFDFFGCHSYNYA